MPARSNFFLRALVAGLLWVSWGCSGDKGTTPPPVPTVDLTGYFVLPSAGFVKFFTGSFSQTYVKDTTVNGVPCVDVLQSSGAREYLASTDRAWVGTLDTAGGGTLFLLSPPLAAIPDLMPETQDHVANAGFLTQTGSVPVRRITRLIDTGLALTVPAGIFDSVALLRQEFWVFTTTGLGFPDTVIDSAYRWFAFGVDEIRRVQWRDGQTDSTVREFSAGNVGGRSYP